MTSEYNRYITIVDKFFYQDTEVEDCMVKQTIREIESLSTYHPFKAAVEGGVYSILKGERDYKRGVYIKPSDEKGKYIFKDIDSGRHFYVKEGDFVKYDELATVDLEGRESDGH